MDKNWYQRPELVAVAAFAVWFASAAVYAVVFEY